MGRKKKYTIESVREFTIIKGGKCLNENLPSINSKLKMECAIGHQWNGTLDQIITRWCVKCNRIEKQKQKLESLKAFAVDRGGKCLSLNYVNINENLDWECKEGHKWRASANTMVHKKMNWCPDCPKVFRYRKPKKTKFSIQDMQDNAHKKGGKCLTENYINSRTKMQWECSEGHKWFQFGHVILKNRSWCPTCSMIKMAEKQKSDNFERMKKYASKKGGKILSEIYISSVSKLTWQCSERHSFEATPTYIKSYNYWCPHCKGITNEYLLKQRLEEYKKIAIFNGGKCLSENYINNYTPIEFQCSKGHTWFAEPSRVKCGTWCPKCANNQRHTIEDMQQLAFKHGGKCISEEYVNYKSILKWQCSFGHTWMARPDNIGKGYWCPVCLPRKGGSRSKLDISVFQKIAGEKGGKLLSLTYSGTGNPHQWQCKEGHIWMTTPGIVKNGSWCPVCSRKTRDEKITGTKYKKSKSII